MSNLVQIGTYIDTEMMTQLNRSQNHRITETQNDQMTKAQTHKLLVISLLRRHETPRKKNFSSIGENDINRSDNIILSFGRIKIYSYVCPNIRSKNRNQYIR